MSKVFTIMVRIKIFLRGMYKKYTSPKIYHFLKSMIINRGLEYFSKEAQNQTLEKISNLSKSNTNLTIWFLPFDTWFSLSFQRPQQLARAFAENGFNVVYYEPWKRMVPSGSQEKNQTSFFQGIKEIEKNLFLLRCPLSLMNFMIRQAEPNFLIMIWPEQEMYIPKSLNNQVLYEVVDDHELIQSFDLYWRKAHQKWLKQSRLVTVTADDLFEKIKPYRSDVLLVPNGVKLEDWTLDEEIQIPDDLAPAREAKTLIGYYGALAEWFDWDMWEKAARVKPDWSFVLIGLPYDGDYEKVNRRVENHDNMFYLGAKPYHELRNYVHFFDVATIPFVINNITNACSPIKLFEYLAAGKPVVATQMREILKYQSVLFASTPDEFIYMLEKAIRIEGDSTFEQFRISDIESNTWRARAAKIQEALGLG